MSAVTSRTNLSIARDPDARPHYQLRAVGLTGGEMELAVWQLPTPATPRLKAPELTATLKGRALGVVETRVFRRLRENHIRLPHLTRGHSMVFDLEEDIALNLALLFRTLAPMHSVDRIRVVTEGIERMSREEAGYWLGMAVHRVNPRRVLAALRLLLTTS